MHESGPYSFFRSRWFALMWASLICLSAATFVYGLRENAAAARIDAAAAADSGTPANGMN